MKKLVWGLVTACAAAVPFANGWAGALPAGYEQLEWIQSDGTAWIDTGVAAEVTAEKSLQTESKWFFSADDTGWIFGAKENSNNAGKQVSPVYIHKSGTTLRAGCGKSYPSVGIWPISSFVGKADFKVVTSFTAESVSVDLNIGDTPYHATDTGAETVVGKNLYVFGDGHTKTTARCYYVKISVNNELVRDFVPCRRKADDMIGLFDLLDQSDSGFHAGATTFTHGEAVGLKVDDIPVQAWDQTNPVEPTVVVRDGDAVLQKGVDYTVAYSGNNGYGTATATITGVPGGDYDGTVLSKTFVIDGNAGVFNVYDADGATVSGSPFGSLKVALAAAPADGVVEMVGNAVWNESVELSGKRVTLKSSGATPAVLYRAGAAAQIALKGVDGADGELVITNLTLDGGAQWAKSDDLTDLTDLNVMEPADVFALTGVNKDWQGGYYGLLRLQSGATVRNIRASTAAVPVTQSYGGFVMESGSRLMACRSRLLGETLADVPAVSINGNQNYVILGGEIIRCTNLGASGIVRSNHSQDNYNMRNCLTSAVITGNVVSAGSAALVLSSNDSVFRFGFRGGTPIVRDNVTTAGQSANAEFNGVCLKVKNALEAGSDIRVSAFASATTPVAGDAFGTVDASAADGHLEAFWCEANPLLRGQVSEGNVVWAQVAVPGQTVNLDTATEISGALTVTGVALDRSVGAGDGYVLVRSANGLSGMFDSLTIDPTLCPARELKNWKLVYKPTEVRLVYRAPGLMLILR